MDLYDVAVARKLSSGGGGGGGSSDFSTAEVTFVNNATVVYDVIFPYILDDYMYSSTSSGFIAGNKEVVLYKGTCELEIVPQGGTTVGISSISGDIEQDGSKFAIIHGNGTITIS